MVDRAVRSRPVRPRRRPVDDHVDCANCSNPAGAGVRVRMLKDFAFTSVGTGDEARERGSTVAQVAMREARAR